MENSEITAKVQESYPEYYWSSVVRICWHQTPSMLLKYLCRKNSLNTVDNVMKFWTSWICSQYSGWWTRISKPLHNMIPQHIMSELEQPMFGYPLASYRLKEENFHGCTKIS